MRHHTVQSSEAGRLDRYLSLIHPEMSRTLIQKLIKGGSVFVNDKKILKSSFALKEGDELAILMPSIKEVGIEAEKISLDIVYEDSDIVVVNKAPGMVVHPTDHGAHISGTLVNALMYHCKDLSGIGGEKRPGIVHRLDKDTSGLIISAKNDAAHHHISQQIEKRTIQKKYVTLLKGHLTPPKGSIEAPVIKAHLGRGKKEMQISSSVKAKYALTHYEVKEYIGDYSLVEVQIVTGRTHQIRVHFKAIGYPVCGDEVYGDPTTNGRLRELGLKRQFLHAAELVFKLPKNNQEVHLSAPLPKDLRACLRELKTNN